MFLKKYKILIYIILSLLIFTLMLPVYSFAITEDSIYVWSNNSSDISTATTPSEEIQSTNQENLRKFFRNYFWWCYINGSKDWNYSI